MKNIIYNIIIVVSLSFGFTSCNDILDETPDNRTSIDSADKISELLVAAYPEAAYGPFLEPMSDNAGDKGPSAGDEKVNEEMYFWRDLNDIDDDTPTNYWNKAYKAIAQANQALVSIEELGGGEAFSAQKGEALVCRAYAHFMLVSIFSKSYSPSTASSDLGIPYVTEPETVLLGNYSRGTVENVFINIQMDLEEGLLLIKDDYAVPGFHFTKQAANAFASRFYMNFGAWQKVIDHSTLALGIGGQGVLRDWENEYDPKSYSEQQLRYASATLEPANLLVVSAESVFSFGNYAIARYQLTNDLADLLFTNRNATGNNWSYSVFGSDELFFNIPKFIDYFKITNQAANIGNVFTGYVLMSTDEALLNRAEAYAMLGQLDNAAADINMSYSVKTASYDPATNELSEADITSIFRVTDPSLYTPFYSIPAESLPFVNAVLTIKRTIFYQEGIRWFDIKRHNINIEHTDAFGNSYTLPKDDLRRQLQIPEAAQSFGIQQNPR
jgi:hypothetical protein